ncbi:hypothetical protein ACS0TY_030742 [Phlomoides rotata]
MAEIMGIHEGLSWLQYLPFQNVVIESDSLTAICALQARREDDTVFGRYIHSCSMLQNSFDNCLYHFVRRSTNTLAHTLARASRSFPSPTVWVEPPTFVDGLLDDICFDCE